MILGRFRSQNSAHHMCRVLESSHSLITPIPRPLSDPKADVRFAIVKDRVGSDLVIRLQRQKSATNGRSLELSPWSACGSESGPRDKRALRRARVKRSRTPGAARCQRLVLIGRCRRRLRGGNRGGLILGVGGSWVYGDLTLAGWLDAMARSSGPRGFGYPGPCRGGLTTALR